jgi:glutamate--cysteine ligase
MTVDPRTERYTDLLVERIETSSYTGPRTYGFEYEFMPVRVLHPGDMEGIYDYLRSDRCVGVDGIFSSCCGMGISFEPGGQVEFRSVPMTAGDREQLQCQLDRVRSLLDGILRSTGIDYEGKGFIPGRGTAPMILPGRRYLKMHERFGHSGARGREMMKGTASVQLHASMRQTAEVLPLYATMLRLTGTGDLRMSAERADIWSRTDDSRCGLVVDDLSGIGSSRDLVREFVVFTMEAADLETGRPWRELDGTTYDSFLEHMTTMFTDIRLNMKGITWELRTPDSLPIGSFPSLWEAFVTEVENSMRDWQSGTLSQ